jgi:hypothetical protein
MTMYVTHAVFPLPVQSVGRCMVQLLHLLFNVRRVIDIFVQGAAQKPEEF